MTEPPVSPQCIDSYIRIDVEGQRNCDLSGESGVKRFLPLRHSRYSGTLDVRTRAIWEMSENMKALVESAGPWRILYSGPCPPYYQAGSAISSWLMLRQLASRGHHIRMVVPTTSRDLTVALPDPVPGNVEIDPFWMPSFPYHTNPYSPLPQSYLTRQREQTFDRLRRAMSHQQWDLILVGRESFLPGVPALAREFDVPCVGFMRGAMKLALSDTHPDKAFAATMIEACRQADLIIPVARHLEEDFLAAGYGNVAAIPNCVDLDLFKPSQERRDLRTTLGLTRNAKVVVHASNFKALKRIDHIVEAARRLIAVDDEIVFLLVGDGPEHADIRERCMRYGLVESFVFPGWVCNNDMADYYNLSDVAVLASETEVMPRFILEAMACGRPVVASDIPASPEIIDHGKDGLLYPGGDIDTLCESVLTLLRDTDRRRRMGRAARNKIAKCFDVRVIAEEFEDTVNRLLAGYRTTMLAPSGIVIGA